MATAASVTTDLTTCPICLDVFDNPKSLPCFHAFCLKCLQGYFSDKSPEDEVLCPMCRKAFEIPIDGLGALPHHFVQRLVDVRKVSSEKLREVPCVVCLEENDESSEEIATATVYCVDCKQKLCERCSRPHGRMPEGAHQLKPLGTDLEQELIQMREVSCDKHKNKQVELYCHQCHKNICLMCFAVKHRQHENGEISEVVHTFRPGIYADNQQIASTISDLRQVSAHIKQSLKKFLSQADSEESKIIKAGEKMKRTVDSQINELVSELQSAKSDSVRQAASLQEKLKSALTAMESFHTYSQALLDKGRPSDITQAACELHDRATELLQNDPTSFYFRPPPVMFTPADIQELTCRHLIGKITVDRESQSVGRVLQTLPQGCMVMGVASLDNQLYVLRKKSSEQIAVYDTDTYRFQRHLSVPGVERPEDIVFCAKFRCAYVSDKQHSCIHRLPLDDAVTKWPVNDKPACLSVTDTHSVLVTCPQVKKIKEFSTDGKLLRQIQLSHDIRSPWHTIQLSTGEFIVCNGGMYDPIHRVCLVSPDGQVIKSFGRESGPSNQQLNQPSRLAVYRDNSVFVADYKNDRVLMLSPTLTHIREVVSHGTCKFTWGPVRLHLDANEIHLYIAVNSNSKGQVVVLSI